MDAELVFRRAGAQDQSLAQQLVDGALREHGLHLLPDSSDVDLSDIREHYDARGGRLELIESPPGSPVGVLGWRPAADGVLELKKLYLSRDARGRGLGRAALERVVGHALIQESSGDRIHDGVQRLALRARDTLGDYAEAAAWMKGAAEAAGLKDVRLEAMEDGPQWRATRGELWVSAPQRYKVTTYADLPMSLASGSGAFEGRDLELVDVGAGSSDADDAGKELKGKVALTSGIPTPVLGKAVKERGAVGVVSSYSTPPWNAPNRLDGDFPDQVGWATVPQRLFPEGTRRPFLFMVSDRRARELRTQLKAGPVRVDVSVQAETFEGHYSILSGVIPGSSRATEEVVLTAHLDHYKPGAAATPP